MQGFYKPLHFCIYCLKGVFDLVKVTYPALFYFDDTDDVVAGYSIFFPDFVGNGATQGENIEDGLEMAADWLGLMCSHILESGESLPSASNINHLSLVDNNPFKDDKDFTMDYDKEKSFITLVSVDLTEYLEASEPIKKTLTIPRWADKLGKELQLNFSQTLTDAIVQKNTRKRA
jgi:predicted RNase H-like HicB family nuclease